MIDTCTYIDTLKSWIKCRCLKLVQAINVIGVISMCADAIMLSPEYNPNARIFAPATFTEKKVSELCPVKPPVTELAKTLNDDWQDKDDAMNQICSDEPPVAINSKFPIVRSDSTSTSTYAL